MGGGASASAACRSASAIEEDAGSRRALACTSARVRRAPFLRSSGLPFLTEHMTMLPQVAPGILFRRPLMPFTEMMYRFLAPVLSAQFITEPTDRPSVVRNLLPMEPARPAQANPPDHRVRSPRQRRAGEHAPRFDMAAASKREPATAGGGGSAVCTTLRPQAPPPPTLPSRLSPHHEAEVFLVLLLKGTFLAGIKLL